MKNISFDNPQYLWICLPLLLLTLVPYFFVFRKDNRSTGAVVSLVLHIVMIAAVTLGVAGMTYTDAITKTEVYVVADVSYSATQSLDTVDAHIAALEKRLPKNSELHVVVFGKDAAYLPRDGEGRLPSVKTATVDTSATDIASALNYTASLFSANTLKRIVLITDGKETAGEGNDAFVRAVENLYLQDIAIDAVYLDDNIAADTAEVQIAGVEYTQSTYLSHETTADVLIRSSTDTKAILTLYKDGVKFAEEAVSLTRGFHVVNFTLDTATEGKYDYEVRIEAREDKSAHNNRYLFHQSVSGKLKVLLITSLPEDVTTAEMLYAAVAEIDAYVNTPNVPYTVEDLSLYDEIILSNTDVRTLKNYVSFMESLDKVVSLFGKSLITVGDTQIQNKTDDVLKSLEDMLPVRFGNSDADPKLYSIVIDISRSMEYDWHFQMAKSAAKQILMLLNEDDYVSVVSFAGEVIVSQQPVKATNRESIAAIIDALPLRQGTFIGTGLNKAMQLMNAMEFSEKQAILISDGVSYTSEPDQPLAVTYSMVANNIGVSVINVGSLDGVPTLTEIAEVGGGFYYFVENEEQLDDLMLSEIADEITDSVIERETEVAVVRKTDAVLRGIEAMPNIFGYIYAKPKASATTVLTVDYEKANGGTVTVPYYAYWNYGNGRVSSFTGALSGAWAESLQSGEGKRFLQNIVTSNVPVEKIDYPYTLDIEYTDVDAVISLIPAALNPDAVAALTLSLPNGETETVEMTFDASRYFYRFRTADIGKYTVDISYTYAGHSFSSHSVFFLSYLPEYDSFAAFSPSVLYKALRNRGEVYENDLPTFDTDNAKRATFTVELTVPLMALAACLYVVDVIVRKLRLADIRGLFASQAKKGGKKHEKADT